MFLVQNVLFIPIIVYLNPIYIFFYQQRNAMQSYPCFNFLTVYLFCMYINMLCLKWILLNIVTIGFALYFIRILKFKNYFFFENVYSICLVSLFNM